MSLNKFLEENDSFAPLNIIRYDSDDKSLEQLYFSEKYINIMYHSFI